MTKYTTTHNKRKNPGLVASYDLLIRKKRLAYRVRLVLVNSLYVSTFR